MLGFHHERIDVIFLFSKLENIRMPGHVDALPFDAIDLVADLMIGTCTSYMYQRLKNANRPVAFWQSKYGFASQLR